MNELRKMTGEVVSYFKLVKFRSLEGLRKTTEKSVKMVDVRVHIRPIFQQEC